MLLHWSGPGKGGPIVELQFVPKVVLLHATHALEELDADALVVVLTAHAEQEVLALALLKVPAAHAEHAELPFVLEYPAAHATHAPVLFQANPATQLQVYPPMMDVQVPFPPQGAVSQLVCVQLVPNVPLGQELQLEEEAVLVVFVGQAEQLLLPEFAANVPAPQAVQFVFPVPLAKVPGPQTEHVPFTELDEPELQAAQLSLLS